MSTYKDMICDNELCKKRIHYIYSSTASEQDPTEKKWLHVMGRDYCSVICTIQSLLDLCDIDELEDVINHSDNLMRNKTDEIILTNSSDHIIEDGDN